MSDDLDPDSAVPLYEQLVRVLRKDIGNGKYRVRLPTEAALVEEYGVSRETVRRAISILATAGEVEVSHGRGTFVVRRD